MKYRINNMGAMPFYSSLRPDERLAGKVVEIDGQRHELDVFERNRRVGDKGAGRLATMGDGRTCWVWPDMVEAIGN